MFVTGCFGGWVYEEIFYYFMEGIGILGLAFHYLLEPFSQKIYQRIPTRVSRITCGVILFLFLVDCVLSYFFRTPITY